MQMVWQYSYQGSLADMERVWCHLPDRLSCIVVQIFDAMGRLSKILKKKPISQLDTAGIKPKMRKVLVTIMLS